MKSEALETKNRAAVSAVLRLGRILADEEKRLMDAQGIDLGVLQLYSGPDAKIWSRAIWDPETRKVTVTVWVPE